VNDYEAQMLQDKTGKKVAELAIDKRAFIITRGGDGSTIYADGKEIIIPSAKPTVLLDPTGCGDAYRAGLMHGIQQGWDWETTGRLASLLGSLKIASRGGQNHAPSKDELAQQFQQHFGFAIKL
jgi:adenosine kinase